MSDVLSIDELENRIKVMFEENSLTELDVEELEELPVFRLYRLL
jgi:hypothetical protein